MKWLISLSYMSFHDNNMNEKCCKNSQIQCQNDQKFLCNDSWVGGSYGPANGTI